MDHITDRYIFFTNCLHEINGELDMADAYIRGSIIDMENALAAGDIVRARQNLEQIRAGYSVISLNCVTPMLHDETTKG
jgi:hypothetical protein